MYQIHLTKIKAYHIVYRIVNVMEGDKRVCNQLHKCAKSF